MLMRESHSNLRVAFVGPAALLDDWAPAGAQSCFAYEKFPADPKRDPADACARAASFGGAVTVVLDPITFSASSLSSLPGLTLGVLPDMPSVEGSTLAALDRVVSFDPMHTGAPTAGAQIWRAIPPPVSDIFFGDVRALHTSPRVMSIGRCTPHREAMLAATKHHHDLLQIIHGICGEKLAGLLATYDVGVYVAPEFGGSVEGQAVVHLAAGQLLLAEPLWPAHGLELGIDYLEVNSPEAIEWTMRRLCQFPEMYHRIRVRGRMKAEQFRSSRVFARLIHDLVKDVAAFG